MMLDREQEAQQDLLVNFLDERFLAEQPRLVVEAPDSLGEVLVVNTADKVGHEAVPDVHVDTGEEELEEVENTGAVVTSREILEDNVAAKHSAVSRYNTVQ